MKVGSEREQGRGDPIKLYDAVYDLTFPGRCPGPLGNFEYQILNDEL